MSVEPNLVEAGVAVDDRGELVFANGFPLADYKRFYFIKNHEPVRQAEEAYEVVPGIENPNQSLIYGSDRMLRQ